ncbi:hypothetical protein XbrCFBP1976_14670 [Xanthomonas bromi]|uniref:Uncharacterized protein n=1 Tax=Xanthomonas bromi TaxID=56449 RepID=A0ABX5BN47_9XANT|nr:hypothetical protein XbrCFBP1976_14670 [Xanthomonas bromi]
MRMLGDVRRRWESGKSGGGRCHHQAGDQQGQDRLHQIGVRWMNAMPSQRPSVEEPAANRHVS